MNVITNNPIITASQAEVDNFMNASGATRRARTATRKSTRKSPAKKGQLGQRIKNFGKKVVDSGVLPIIAAQLGSGNSASMPPIDVPTPTTDLGSPKQEMAKSTKIMIGVGVVALIGVGLYMYKKSQGK